MSLSTSLNVWYGERALFVAEENVQLEGDFSKI